MSNDFARVAEVSSRVGCSCPVIAVLHIDLWLVVPLLVLSIGGLFVLYSASGQSDVMLNTQMRNIAVAMTVLLVTAQFRVETLRGVSPYIFVLATLLLVAVAFFGVGAKGAQRWLSLGLIRFQPSEVMKVAMPLALAWWLSKKALPPDLRSLAVAFAMVAVPSGLILQQPDSGNIATGCHQWPGRHLYGWNSVAVYFFNDGTRPRLYLACVGLRVEGLSEAARAYAVQPRI